MYTCEDRIEEADERVHIGQAEQAKGADKATNDREHSQNDQWDGHNGRSFMDDVTPPSLMGRLVFVHDLFVGIAGLRVAMIVTIEDAKEEPEHVEGGKTGRENAHRPQEIEDTPSTAGGLGEQGTENFVFAPETGKGWYATDGEGGN